MMVADAEKLEGKDFKPEGSFKIGASTLFFRSGLPASVDFELLLDRGMGPQHSVSNVVNCKFPSSR